CLLRRSIPPWRGSRFAYPPRATPTCLAPSRFPLPCPRSMAPRRVIERSVWHDALLLHLLYRRCPAQCNTRIVHVSVPALRYTAGTRRSLSHTRVRGDGNYAIRCDAPPQVAVCRRQHHRGLCPRGGSAWVYFAVGHGPYYCALLPDGARAHLL